MAFRLGNVDGRAVLIDGENWHDLAAASNGSFSGTRWKPSTVTLNCTPSSSTADHRNVQSPAQFSDRQSHAHDPS